jgi:hypothetical protein
MHAQKAISKGQCMGTGSWSLLNAFSQVRNPNLNNPAILNTTQGFCFWFFSRFGHDISPFRRTLQEELYQQYKLSIGRQSLYL